MPATRVVTRLQDQDDVTVASITRGDLLYRGASAWQNLAAGAAGQVLQSGGAGADPVWGTVAHSSLSGLTSGDPHTQYPVLAPATAARNTIKSGGAFPPLTLEPVADASQIIARVNTVTADSGDFNWGLAPANNAGHSRRNTVLTWGYNQDPSGGAFDLAGEPSVCHRIESFFSPTPGTNYMEVHIQYNHPGGFSCRPMSYTINRDTNNVGEGHQVHVFDLIDPDTDISYFTALPLSLMSPNGLTVNTNNVTALQQKNAAGSALIPLITFDNLNRLLLGSGTTACVAQQNFSVGGTLITNGNASFGTGATTTAALNARGPGTSGVFVTVANLEAGVNSDPGGCVLEMGPSGVNFGGKIYAGRWSSTDRGLRLVGQNAIAGAENAEVRINAEAPNVALVTNNIIRLQADGSGNVAVGAAAIATTATNGFLYMTSMAGTPTGVPTSFTGRHPIVYDTTANRIWIYNGSWRSVALA